MEAAQTTKELASGEEANLEGAKSVTDAFAAMPEAKEGDAAGEGMKNVEATPFLFDTAQIQAEVPQDAGTGEAAAQADSKSKIKIFIKDKAGKIKKVTGASADKLVAMLNKVVEVLAKVTKAKQASEAVKSAYNKVTTAAKSGASKTKEKSPLH